MKKILSGILILAVLIGVVFSVPVVATDGNTYKKGDIIEFGSYPQSLVKDAKLIDELNEEALNWHSYKYYSGSNEDDFARFTDVWVKGTKYRMVKFSKYRPYDTWYLASDETDNTHQSKNGYEQNKVYWFKFEPLKWRILDPDSGLLMCDNIITSEQFYHRSYRDGDNITIVDKGSVYGFIDISYGYYRSREKKEFANLYYQSDLYNFLNDTFYNTAFTTCQKSVINDNSVTTDDYHIKKYSDYYKAGFIKKEKAVSSKISVPSYAEASALSKESRTLKATDYSLCQGLNLENKSAGWWLRSQGTETNQVVCVTGEGNIIANKAYVTRTEYGVVPLMKINLDGYKNANCDLAVVSNTDATLGKVGNVSYSCKNCKTVYSYQIAPFHKANNASHSYATLCGKNCQICGFVRNIDHEFTANPDARYLKSKATCTQKAVYYKSCRNCKEQGLETFGYGSPLGHQCATVTTCATLNKNGKVENKCLRCKKVIKTVKSINAVSAISVSGLTYTGKNLGVKVKVTDKAKKAVSSFSVAYYSDKNCKKKATVKNVGTYYAKIILKGNYQGTFVRAFKVVPNIKLNKTSYTVRKKRKFTLKATVNPKGGKITWATSNKRIATVTKSGVVKGVRAGTANITCTYTYKNVKYQKVCKVRVK